MIDLRTDIAAAAGSGAFGVTASLTIFTNAATAVRPGCRILVFCGTGWAWSLDQLEDFVDFYLTGKHRLDDPFGRMEAHSLEAGRIELLRNISAFAFVKRGMDETTPSQCVMPVRGPRFLALA